MRAWRQSGDLIAAAALFVLLALIGTWPQARQISTGVNDFGDPLLNAWTLAWTAHVLPAHPAQWFNANIFYPETGTLAYSESLIVPALIVAPVLWLGGNPILAHNLLVLAGYVCSGLAVYVLVRSLTGHRGGAVVAGVVCALYPERIPQYGHLQLQLIFWMPLALWAVHRLRLRANASRGALSGAFAALQLYSCLYYGLFEIVPLFSVAIATLLTSRPEQRIAVTRALVVGLVVFAALSAPLMPFYRAASRVVGERTEAEVQRWSAVPSDFLRAPADVALYGDPTDQGDGERRLFPGVIGPAVALAAFVPPLSTGAIAYGMAAAISGNLALGFNGLGYRALYDRFLPFRAIRVPARSAMCAGLAMAVLAGLGIARICRGRGAMAQAAIVTVAVVLITLESRPRPLQLSELPDAAPAVYSWLATQPRGVVCEYPVGNLQGRIGPQDATYMYYSTRHWQPMVNGYSGFAPPSYAELLDRLREFPDDRAIDYLRQRGVTYLLVHSAFYIRGDFAADVRSLKARADLESAGRFSWRNKDVTEVFRIRLARRDGVP